MKVLAAVAHPDDIEFMMAGTLLALKERGCEIHFWNLCNGCCGTERYGYEEITALRLAEAKEATQLAGGIYHEPLFDDMAIFYDRPSLAKVAAVVREIEPTIILTHPPHDYMEDHEAVARLVVSGAFSRSMVPFPTDPPRPVTRQPVRIYHALPHSLRDGYNRVHEPHRFVDIGPHLELKRSMLAAHRTQKEWLDASQGMDAYLEEMERISTEMGSLSGRFRVAEAFRLHHYAGFCAPDFDPLAELLGAACLQR